MCERDEERESVCVCVCVLEREREREREGESVTERVRGKDCERMYFVNFLSTLFL